MKTFKNILLTTLPSIIVLWIVLELFFRFIIPASNPPKSIFDEKERMECFSTESKEGIFTIGRFAEIKARWQINNMGWNYPIDYYYQNEKKLIAVIGDSYVESFQVNVGENYPFLLREKILKDYEVYAFGKSGAPLSQYLHISRYVKNHFNPDIFIINVVHNDFDESIEKLKPYDMPFLRVSVNQSDSISEVMPNPAYPSQHYRSLKRIIIKSALFRYLYFNLHVRDLINNKKSAPNESYEANINTQAVRENQELIFKVTNYVVKTLREENSDKRVIIIFDAPRDNIYNNTLNESNVLWMHAMMDTICSKNYIEYIDLSENMPKDYIVNGIKFNSEFDRHWNEYGHKFVAKVLYDYLENKKEKIWKY